MVKHKATPLPKKKQKLKPMDEEIDSDEADIENEDDFFEPEETPEEKRIRLAKELIKKAEESMDPDEVNTALTHSALSSQGRFISSIAEEVKDLSTAFAKGHLLGVTCLAVSSGVCVTGSKDCCLIVWSLETLQKLHIIKGFRHDKKCGGHSDEIIGVAISDDGKFIVSGGKDRIIRVWDGRTYEFLDAFKGHRDTITSVKFMPFSHVLVSISADRSVKTWNCDDMVFLDTYFGHQSHILDLDTLPGERALTCSRDCTARIWKTQEDSQIVFSGHIQSIDCVRAVAYDTFVTGGQDGSLSLWKISKKKPFKKYQNAHGGEWITALAVLKGTDLVASGSSDGWVRFYKVGEAIQEVNKVCVKGYVNALEFTANGEKLVAGISANHKWGRWMPDIKTKPGITVIQTGVKLTHEILSN